MKVEEISVRAKKMEQFADDMRKDCFVTAEAYCDKLREIVSSLNNMWEGDASEAYKDKINKKLDHLERRIKKEQNMCRLLEEAKNEYDKVEDVILNDVISTITYQ